MARATADRALDHGLLRAELAEDLLGVLADGATGADEHPGPDGTHGPDGTQGPEGPEGTDGGAR